MHQTKQSNDASQSEGADVTPFLRETLQPLLDFKEPGVLDPVLKDYHATVIPLDFTTGAPYNGAPALIRLMDIAVLRTSWEYGGGEGTNRYLHNFGANYIWTPGSVFINLLPSKPREPDPRKPHVIHHVIDSTPWKSGTLRTSEFKTIVFVAAANKLKAAYKGLDYFGVTVISFWHWEVRIVQGLVNFKTRDVDIRVSPAQGFRDGLRNDDGSIDTRFLTLLAYHLGEVVHFAE
ncbi:hypothetical protein MY11210_002466 [Beauveria gryllotalpidicola]